MEMLFPDSALTATTAVRLALINLLMIVQVVELNYS
jgi:hypothetical protein